MSWQPDIEIIDKFLPTVDLSSLGPVQIDPITTVIDPVKFTETHLAFIKAHMNNPVFQPYLDRLKTFCRIIHRSKK